MRTNVCILWSELPKWNAMGPILNAHEDHAMADAHVVGPVSFGVHTVRGCHSCAGVASSHRAVPLQTNPVR